MVDYTKVNKILEVEIQRFLQKATDNGGLDASDIKSLEILVKIANAQAGVVQKEEAAPPELSDDELNNLLTLEQPKTKVKRGKK